MGTNFYIRGKAATCDNDPEWHIGKRSAAGLYCWDCGRSLFRGPIAELHGSGRYGFHAACPDCGKKLANESLTESTCGRELGFNTQPPRKKSGVSSCSSFTWAMSKKAVIDALEGFKKTPPVCGACGRPFENMKQLIEDEYGELYTPDEFFAMLDECPIEYTNSIGEWFS